ncbi:unnamed protein product [Rotaria sp. Silwood1]|nr:unnamed protein product [Rotaria sp. Silwood1]
MNSNSINHKFTSIIEQYSNDQSTRNKISDSRSSSSSPHLQNYKTTAQKRATTNNLHRIPTKSKWSTRKRLLVETTSTTTTTTTISSVIVSAYWSFDNTTTDSYGVYNGLLVNNPLFTTSGSSNLPYVGHGQALNFNSASNQSFVVSSPFFNLSYTSFTIEAWIYYSTSVSDRGIFDQCQCSTCSNQCLYLIIRNNRLYVDFTSNYLSGSTAISTAYWYHIAFVYNYETRQQILYLNGVQDAIKSNAQPYQGQNGSIHIGSAQTYSTTYYYQSYIDNVAITTRAKSSPFERRISKSAISQLDVRQKKYISSLETPKNVRLHHIEETNNNNQHHSKISSPPSPPLSSHLQKYKPPTQESTITTNNLHQIPTISKWSTRKKVLVGTSTSLIIASVITVATVLGVLLTKSKETSTTTTTASTVNVSAYWSFDSTTADSNGVYNGLLVNNPLFTASGSNSLPYVGHGQALNFTSASIKNNANTFALALTVITNALALALMVNTDALVLMTLESINV